MWGLIPERKYSLFDKICEGDNLYRAWKKVRSNKAHPGIDGVTVEQFENKVSKNLDIIRKKLRKNRFKFDPVIRFYVRTKKGKIRPLNLLTVKDKIVQAAILFQIDPIIDRNLTKCCFGFRKGMGVETAVRAVTNARINGFKHGVKADIESFFDKIERPRLFALVKKHIRDDKVVDLIVRSINVQVMDQKRNFIVINKGVPQGAILSPILSNLYLNKFDRTIVRKDRKLIRYSDDFLILCKRSASRKQAIYEARKILGRIGLNIKQKSLKFIDFNKGFFFLGYSFRKKTIKLIR